VWITLIPSLRNAPVVGVPNFHHLGDGVSDWCSRRYRSRCARRNPSVGASGTLQTRLSLRHLWSPHLSRHEQWEERDNRLRPTGIVTLRT
jgi:hypothetical protein